LAAEAAEEAPRAAMMAAPRLPTVSQKAPWSQAVSVMTLVAGRPLIVAWAKEGNIVGLWFP